MATCARWADCGEGPSPPNGLPIRTAAIPQVAIAHAGSCASTVRKALSSNQNEWSRATPRWKVSCTAALQEFAKSTLPKWSCDLDWPAPALGKQSIRETDRARMSARPFIDALLSGSALLVAVSVAPNDCAQRPDASIASVRSVEAGCWAAVCGSWIDELICS